MFKIEKEKFGILDSIVINNKSKGIEIEIITQFGSIINKYIVNHSPFSFISGYKSYQELIETNPFFSRSAKLFPFPNRLDKGHYSYHSQSFQLPANFPWSEHAVHGLLYNQPFECIHSEASQTEAELTLRFETERLCDGYPFAFRLDTHFHINSVGALTCTTSITNLSDQTMPFGDAWHPYFSLGSDRSECLLHMPSCFELEHIEDLPSGQRSLFTDFIKPTSLAEYQLNHCFEFGPQTPIELTLSRADNRACLTYRQDANYPYIQLYTPASEQSIAIEPMTCPANAFNNHIGLLHLAPGQHQSFQWQCEAQYSSH